MASPLSSLPIELLEAVLKSLEPAQLLEVRLVCQELNVRSSHLVGPAHFSTISTDLSCSSMNQLEALATESPFGPYVRTLHIATRGNMEELGNGFEWPRHMGLRQATTRQRHHGEIHYGLNTLDVHLCPGIRKLRHLLASRLPHCRSFSLEKHYGTPQCSQLHSLQGDFITPLDVLAIIISLSIEPSCLSITSIALRLTSSDYKHRLENQNYRQMDLFHADLPNLKSFAFDQHISIQSRNLWLKCITCILAKATMLEDLELGTLVGDRWCYSSYAWIFGCLHSLVRLKLRRVQMLVSDLQNLLHHSQRTLKTLYLSHIHIPGIRIAPHIWPKLLRNMGHDLLALEQITIEKLSTGRMEPHRLDFGEDSEQHATKVGILTVQAEASFLGVKGILGATFEGPGMDNGLEMLARALERGLQN